MKIFEKYEELGLRRNFGIFVASMELVSDVTQMHDHLMWDEITILAAIPNFEDNTVLYCAYSSTKFRALAKEEEIPIYRATVGKGLITTQHSYYPEEKSNFYTVDWEENTNPDQIKFVRDKTKD